VDLDLSNDQELLRDTTARFIETACPLTSVRELSASRSGEGADYRRQAAELGWHVVVIDVRHALLTPEPREGLCVRCRISSQGTEELGEGPTWTSI